MSQHVEFFHSLIFYLGVALHSTFKTQHDSHYDSLFAANQDLQLNTYEYVTVDIYVVE